nr:MAG: hypothetical protein DIU78_08830 [Pseudomonadota bacterium]
MTEQAKSTTRSWKLVGMRSALVLAVVAAGAATYAGVRIAEFETSMKRVYDVPLRPVQRSTDPAVLARGEHLARSLGGCFTCHGQNLGGGRVEKMGPLGQIQAPNITSGKQGMLAAYGDAELARLLKHGVRRDGTSVRFMPSQDYSWWPDSDIDALISYLRTVPPVDGTPGVVELGLLGKLFDRLGMVAFDVARRIDHENLPQAPPPSESAQYGAYIARLCQGCHGEKLSGGRIPGTPSEIPEPSNLTPHETGLKDWTFADFDKLMRTGIRKDGSKLHPFMPTDNTKHFSDTEMKALWAFLRSLPPIPRGNR